MNILLLEDSAVAQYLHAHMLKKLEHTVDVVEAGLPAIEMAKKKQYDVVFVDIGLPDISGIEVISALCAIRATSSAKMIIVVLTGYSGDEEKDICLKAGADYIFHKPVNMKILRDFFSQLGG